MKSICQCLSSSQLDTRLSIISNAPFGFWQSLHFSRLFAYMHSCALLVPIRLQQKARFNNSCDIREFITSNHWHSMLSNVINSNTNRLNQKGRIKCVKIAFVMTFRLFMRWNLVSRPVWIPVIIVNAIAALQWWLTTVPFESINL